MAQGRAITMGVDSKLHVPHDPVIPFIEGDGTGPDIWAASVRVFNAAVQKAYGDKRRIVWHEVLAGEKAFHATNNWLPDETIDAFKKYLVGIKGPLTTPVGGGIRSLNVALRQLLDLYVCLRPVRWFQGVPSPASTAVGHCEALSATCKATPPQRGARRPASGVVVQQSALSCTFSASQPGRSRQST